MNNEQQPPYKFIYYEPDNKDKFKSLVYSKLDKHTASKYQRIVRFNISDEFRCSYVDADSILMFTSSKQLHNIISAVCYDNMCANFHLYKLDDGYRDGLFVLLITDIENPYAIVDIDKQYEHNIIEDVIIPLSFDKSLLNLDNEKELFCIIEFERNIKFSNKDEITENVIWLYKDGYKDGTIIDKYSIPFKGKSVVVLDETEYMICISFNCIMCVGQPVIIEEE